MVSTKITDFQVSWTADHEQYFQGHGISEAKWTHCAIGVGETMREALDDALETLSMAYNIDTSNNDWMEGLEDKIITELISQVREPEMLDWNISDARAGYCENAECSNEDCAVCAGEWHYYVMVDVKVE